MSRSTTTGLYTRVSNSFSQPITGTTIDPTDADTFFDDVEESMNSFICTSTTSLAVGTGTKAFTTQTTKTFLVGMFVQAFSQADHANYMYGTVVSYTGGVLTLDVTDIGGSGTFTDWLLFTSGVRGGTGLTGDTGPSPGIRQAYSSTTTDADPGAGAFRLNNATPASATAAYIDNVDAAGATVSTILDQFDDSTSTTKGFVRFEKSSDPTVWAQFAVTGSVVDGTGYRKLTLGSGSGSGAFTNADVFAITFFRSGDAGTNGAVAINGTPSLNQLAVWHDSTTVKGVAITGLVKGNGASAPAAAVAGTDYCAATSGSSVLKGSSGSTTAATAGTDYMKPDTTSNLTAGFIATSDGDGTQSTGTYTPDPATGNFKHITANGAFTLAPPSNPCTMVVEVLNGASAGTITTSGFTKVNGDTYATTNALKWAFHILKTQNYSRLTVESLN